MVSNALLVVLMVLAAVSGLVALWLAQPVRRSRLPRFVLPGCLIMLACSVAAVLAIAVRDDVAPVAQPGPDASRPAWRTEIPDLLSASGDCSPYPRAEHVAVVYFEFPDGVLGRATEL